MTTGFQHTTATGSSRTEFSDLVERAGGDLVIRALDPEQSLSPIPCIRGLHSIDRCDLWLEAAEKVGAREKTKRLIEDRRDYLRGHRDDAPAEDLDVVDSDDETEADPRADDSPSSESDESESKPVVATTDDTESDTTGPGPDVDPEMVAALFTTVDDVRDRLDQETDRDEPRPEVVGALNRRLRELKSESDSDGASGNKVAATDGGRP